MNGKIPNIEEGFLKNRRNFASLVNNVCFGGRRKIAADDLELVTQRPLDDSALARILPHHVRTVMMRSPLGVLKIIELGQRRQRQQED